jgi:hypothetical protein
MAARRARGGGVAGWRIDQGVFDGWGHGPKGRDAAGDFTPRRNVVTGDPGGADEIRGDVGTSL